MARAVWVAPRLVKIFAGVGGGVFWGDVFPIALDDVGGCLVLMAPIVKPCGRTCALQPGQCQTCQQQLNGRQQQQKPNSVC